ncbi:MAG: ABC transporter permease [Fimbriimonadales bacterium]|nr:ABC transporter permease [Fimbriimonadales bacterium]
MPTIEYRWRLIGRQESLQAGRIARRMLKTRVLSALLGAGMVLGALSLLILATGEPLGKSLLIVLQGATGYPRTEAYGPLDAWDAVLHDMTLLLLTGLSVAVALQAGLFNIGAAGQLLMGAIGAAWAGALTGVPAPLHLPFALLTGAAAGAAWAFLPVRLKVKRGAHEVISTIMFNYIALYLTHWLTTGRLKDPAGDAPQTAPIAQTAQLPLLGEGFLQASWGLAIAVLTALGLWAVLYRTVWGYEVRATGANRDAADAAGAPTARRMTEAMLLAGALAGLAGAIEVCGTQHRFFEGFPSEYGFDGIAVALLAGNHPALALLTAWLMSALRVGAFQLHAVTGAPKEIATAAQAVLILYVAAVYLRKRRLES